MIWSTSDAELELDFEDATKDFTVNGNDIALNFKIHLDAIMAKLITLANQNLLIDGMEMESLKLVLVMTMVIRTLGANKDLLENEMDLDDKLIKNRSKIIKRGYLKR
jgi:hypothetical protein